MNVRLLAESGDPRAALFRDALVDQCKRLDLPLVVEESAPLDRPSGGDLLVILLDPAATLTPHDPALKAFLCAGGIALPVARTAAEAGSAVNNTCLAPINAFLQTRYGSGDEWTAALVDEVLARLWVGRRRRRVFVSYKRTDSAGVARQLFEHLSGLGYEVFLDEASIAPADDFQKRLAWWLNDADLVLLLASPYLDSSRWVLEEITFAQNHGIGILAIIWPPESPGPSPLRPSGPRPAVLDALMADQQMQLDLGFFTDATPNRTVGEHCTLAVDGLNEVVARAARQRTIGLRDRLVDLVAFTQQHLTAGGITPTQSGPGDFRFERRGEPHLVRVVPFRPDVQVYYDLAAEAGTASVVGCLYAESSATDAETIALGWCLEGTRGAPGRTGGAQLTLRLWAQPGGPLP